MRRNKKAIMVAVLAAMLSGCGEKSGPLSVTPEDPAPGVVHEASTDIEKLLSCSYWGELPIGGIDSRHYRFRSWHHSVEMYNVKNPDGLDSVMFYVNGTFSIDDDLNLLSINGVRLFDCSLAGAGVAAANDTSCTGYRAQLDGNGDTLRFTEEYRYSWSGDTLLLESGHGTAVIVRKLMPYTLLLL